MVYCARWHESRQVPLPEAYLTLAKEDRKDILTAFAAQSGKSERVLEKDVWVCWVLNALFTMPDRFPMAFKGGTSLSKVFDAIYRFSEDVDVTINYASLDASIDPFGLTTTNNQRDRLTDRLRDLVKDHVETTVAARLRDRLANEFGIDGDVVFLDSDDPESVWVRYPSALDDSGDYLRDAVKLEFGGRNVITPSEPHTITPYLAGATSELTFPSATITVLAAERTFWEKATLIHAALGRDDFRTSTSRLSRHWYDLDQLSSSPIGANALASRDLLDDVVQIKKVFYRSGRAAYDLCATGGLRLVPAEASVAAHLGTDYEEMIRAGYFEGAPPKFDDILTRLSALQSEINAPISS